MIFLREIVALHLILIDCLSVVCLPLVLQCKVTVPKLGSIQDLCTAVGGLLKVAPDKVMFCVVIDRYCLCHPAHQ